MRSSHPVGHTVVVLVLILACASSPSGLSARAAVTVYVDVANSSGVEDGTLAHPYNRIQEGISAAAGGDTVQVAAGTYPEKIVLKSGVQLLGAGAGVTHIDAAGQGDAAVSVAGAGAGTVVDGFTIANGTGRIIGIATYGGGFYVDNSTLVLRNCIVADNFSSNGAAGIQSINSTITIDRCVFKNSRGTQGGAMSIDGGTVILQSSIVDRSTAGLSGALHMFNGASFTSVNNIIMHTYYGPAIVVRSSANATILNTTIVNNGGNGIEAHTGAGAVTIRNTILWGNGDDLVNVTATYSDIQDGDAGPGNIAADPLFRDPASDGYRLSPASPCVDAGSGEGAPAADQGGVPRPLDGNADGNPVVDIGAYELDPDNLLGDFGKTAPASGATVPDNLALSWSASARATTYEYCIDKTDNNACDGEWLAASGTTVQPYMARGATYYWQVRARNTSDLLPADAGAWWSCTWPIFRVHLPAAFNGCPPADRDDFSDPTTGWPVVDNQDYAMGYLYGEYRILARTPNYLFTVTGQVDPGDYAIEVDVRAASHPDGAAGVIFARSSAGYYLYLVSDGAFSVLYRDSVAGTWTVVVNWRVSAPVRPSGQRNRLRVVHAQSVFRLYANGQPVLEPFSDAGRIAGGLGLVAVAFSPNYDAHFDNVVIYSGSCIGAVNAPMSPVRRSPFPAGSLRSGADAILP